MQEWQSIADTVFGAVLAFDGVDVQPTTGAERSKVG